jgi:AcrR family transcriptional regulator
LPLRPNVVLDARKWPVQARSNASVNAILDATIQVLLQVGKERLTTTRVAARAGVSVGTLYQYFPNKSALLQAVLKRHFDEVIAAVERVCREQRGKTLAEMAGALVSAFLAAKMRDARTSVALYSVSSDVDGAKALRELSGRANQAIIEMLGTAAGPVLRNPPLAAEMLQGAMAGVSRRLLESDAPEARFETFREELMVFVRAYLKAAAEPRGESGMSISRSR